MSRRIKALGIKSVLSGEGADEVSVFMGLPVPFCTAF